jgi:hypothetical protein
MPEDDQPDVALPPPPPLLPPPVLLLTGTTLVRRVAAVGVLVRLSSAMRCHQRPHTRRSTQSTATER